MAWGAAILDDHMTQSNSDTHAPGLAAKLIEIALLAAAIGIVFLILNWAHFQWLPVSVILYACVVDAAFATIAVLLAYRLFWWPRTSLSPTEAALTAIAANLLVLLYAVMGPTVIDRSLSIYIVQKIDMRGGEVAQAAMPDIFVKEYMPEFRLVDVRLTEQVNSGTVTIEGGCIRLTGKGRTLSRFAGFYRRNFLPQRRSLMGEITDQLTDPFKGAKQVVDTTCPNPAER